MGTNKNNLYCTPQEHEYPRWDMMDVSIWKLMKDDPLTYKGDSYLYLYKDTYVKYHKNIIIQSARDADISPLLLASVAWQEAGGKPDKLKPNVLLFRQFVDFFKNNNAYSNKVSIGIIAIQIRAAAETLGIDPTTLTTSQQLQISRCLQSDDFNIKIVALHLRNLIKYDYPGADAIILSDEQLILVGARYNRGVERSKDDFINAIFMDPAAKERDYISYGLAIIKRRSRVEKLLGSD